MCSRSPQRASRFRSRVLGGPRRRRLVLLIGVRECISVSGEEGIGYFFSASGQHRIQWILVDRDRAPDRIGYMAVRECIFLLGVVSVLTNPSRAAVETCSCRGDVAVCWLSNL